MLSLLEVSVISGSFGSSEAMRAAALFRGRRTLVRGCTRQRRSTRGTCRQGSEHAPWQTALPPSLPAGRLGFEPRLPRHVGRGFEPASPNSSLERTSSSQLRCLAAAAHVER